MRLLSRLRALFPSPAPPRRFPDADAGDLAAGMGGMEYRLLGDLCAQGPSLPSFAPFHAPSGGCGTAPGRRALPSLGAVAMDQPHRFAPAADAHPSSGACACGEDQGHEIHGGGR